MTAEIEHIIFEQPRRIRGTADAIRTDRVDERLARVERRLDIVDAELKPPSSRDMKP